jgi:cell division septation protein DedD
MAERRYGFRFSFAEGCVIVASLFGASFLVFLFGVYSGRELEARKAAEHASSVRLTISQEEGQPRASVSEGKATKDGREKPSGSPPPIVEVNPPKVNEGGTPPIPPTNPSVSTPLAPSPVKEAEGKTESTQNVHIAAKEEKPPSPPPEQHVQGKPQAPKETASGQVDKKLQATGGRWSVQIHATRDAAAAQQLAKKLRSQGYAPSISKVVRDGEIWYRVRIGSFTSADEARSSVGRLRREGQFSQAYPVSN